MWNVGAMIGGEQFLSWEYFSIFFSFSFLTNSQNWYYLSHHAHVTFDIH